MCNFSKNHDLKSHEKTSSSRPLLLTEALTEVALSEPSPPLVFLSPDSSKWRIHTAKGPGLPTITAASER